MKPIIAEIFSDNGGHSHWSVIDADTGETIIQDIKEVNSLTAIFKKLKEIHCDIFDLDSKILCENCNKRFAEGFRAGQSSILRQNKSGCCCIIDDNSNVVSACGAHENWRDQYIKEEVK